VVTLWVFANGYIPWVALDAHPVYFALVMLSIPLLREFHFYLIHRLIHAPVLYRHHTTSIRVPGRASRCTRSSTSSTSPAC
jgi:sterol desaturase/sphingolipid hydroxylase (fatty acid hydroxylase superfamily)